MRPVLSLISVAILTLGLAAQSSAFQAPEQRVEFIPVGTEWIAGHGVTSFSGHAVAAPDWFRARHGDGWQIRRHGPNSAFSHYWGGAIAVDPAATQDDAAALLAAEDFWSNNPELLPAGVTLDDMSLWSNVVVDGTRFVSHQQTIAGVPVLRASTFVAISDGKISWLGVRCFGTDELTADVLVKEADARLTAELALRDMGTSGTGTATGLSWLPRILDDHVQMELVQTVALRNPAQGLRWTAFVDARENVIVALRDERMFLTAGVELEHHERNPSTPMVVDAGSYLRVVLDGSNNYADGNGEFTTAGNTVDLGLQIRGEYVNVNNEAGSDMTADMGTVGDGDVVLWQTDGSEYELAQMDAYAFHLIVRTYALGLDNSLDLVDMEMTVNVNYGDTCNAWSSGDELTFLREGDGCNNTAMLADVMYHEFGHSFHMYSVIWGVGDFYGDVSEAFGDTMSFLLTDDAIISPYFMTNGSGIRDLEPNHVYPDDVVGEVHEDGLILGGALWDLRTILQDELGDSAGQAAVEQIYTGMAKVTADMPSSYEAALWADDDNDDLTDGTPNMCAIDTAFGMHGLLAGGSGALVIEHEPVVRSTLNNQPIAIEASVTAFHPECAEGAIGDVRLAWSVDGGDSWDDVAMDDLGAGDYSSEIPGVPWGTRLLYRIEAEDTESGETVTRPTNPSDTNYYLYVGELTEILCDNFDDEALEWTHELLSGQASEGADDWMTGSPRGNGGDPDEAYSGNNVWGNDLALEENWDGMYQNDKINTLYSPIWDLTDHENVRLQFRRWLGVEDGLYDHGRIYVNEEVAWENADNGGGVHHEDAEWILFDLDITEWAAEQEEVQIRWEIESDGGMQFGGWTIDDVCLYETVAYVGDDDDDDDDDNGDDDDGEADDDDSPMIVEGGGCNCTQAPDQGSWPVLALSAALLLSLIVRRRLA